MTSMIPDLDERLERWLADPAAPALPETEYRFAPAHALGAHERAIAEARSHEGCPLDHRTRGVLIRVIGRDMVDTVQTIPPGIPLNCVLGALNADDEVVGYQAIGFEADHERFDDHETNPDLLDEFLNPHEPRHLRGPDA